MASITGSPIRAPMMANSMDGGKWNGRNTGRKRRPVDPEETGSVPSAPYEQPNAKRPRTIDDVLGSLSLRTSDPPGNSFCYKRKSDVGVEDGPLAKVARSHDSAALSILDESGSNNPGWKMDPEGRKGDSPSKVASELLNSSESPAQQNFQGRQKKEVPAKSDTAYNTDANEMLVDDSDRESDSSVSESSIRNAMYQLVFGRRNPPLPLTVGAVSGCGQYDAVDSKIEDIIRRSRLEAVIKSQKKDKNEFSASDMDMDAEWNPGHG